MASSPRPEVASIVPTGVDAAAAGTDQQLPPGIGVQAFVNGNEGLRAAKRRRPTDRSLPSFAGNEFERLKWEDYVTTVFPPQPTPRLRPHPPAPFSTASEAATCSTAVFESSSHNAEAGSAPVTPLRSKSLNSQSAQVESTPVSAQSSSSTTGHSREEDGPILRDMIANRRLKMESISDLLQTVGLAESYSAIVSKASERRQDQEFFDEIQKIQLLAENESQIQSETRGIHWFQQLATAIETGDPTGDAMAPDALTLRFVASPNSPLAPGAVTSKRKPDALLVFPCDLGNPKPKFEHIAVPLEFTNQKAESFETKSNLQAKSLQIIGYMRHTLISQPLRMSVIGLITFKTRLALLVLDREALRFAYLDDPWSKDNILAFASLATLLLGLQASQAGLFPFVRYKCDRDRGLTPISVSKRLLDVAANDESMSPPLASAVVSHLLFKSSPAGSCFSRATCVLAPSLQHSCKDNQAAIQPRLSAQVIKFQCVDDGRMHREVNVWRAIDDFDWSTCTVSGPMPGADAIQVKDHLAAVDRAFVCRRFPWQTPLDMIPKDSGIVTRHQAVVVYRNPRSNVVRLTDKARPPKPSQLVAVIKTLLVVLLKLSRGPDVLHRDISTGNVLHFEGHLVLSDYDCAWTVTLKSSSDQRRQRTGTLDTMAADVLRSCVPTLRRLDFRHELRHDIESAVYVLLKVLWFHLRPQMSKPELDFWSTVLHFDDPNVNAQEMCTARESLWGGMYGEVLCEHLTRASPELGRLVEKLLEQRLKVTSYTSEEDIVKRLWVLLDCADQVALDEELKNKWAKH
ncbi:hypothetical protein OIV83_004515 [Microbotryomycetes sp. JL201]|nr:hypothetical protein OIV83_004515 [Microbotryomycetes sp. JL201]